MIVVADATPLIALAKIEKLSLLRRLFGTLHIPPAVYTEAVTQAPQRPGAYEVRGGVFVKRKQAQLTNENRATWIKMTPIQDTSTLRYLRAELDPGEA